MNRKQKTVETSTKQLNLIALICLVTGLLSIALYVYDLMFPNHFVGDMYGLEVMIRFFYLAVVVVPMIIGSTMLRISNQKKRQGLRIIWNILVILPALILFIMALEVVWSRHIWEIRQRYPSRSTQELLQLAAGKKDQFAIEALQLKRDPASVPGLCQILLNESELSNLRICAAHALGEIGGEAAKAALEDVLSRSPNEYLQTACEYALYTRMKVVRQPEGSSEDTSPND